jgi:Leucine-rich repeat (LRR) protein
MLDLRDNKLTKLPDAFGKLLTKLPDKFANRAIKFGDLTTLTTLDLSNNSLTQLPDTFKNLTALTTLDLSNNSLTQLPDAFENLTALTTLDLSNNPLTQLPGAFENLTALTTLDLSNNSLTQLRGKFFWNLTALKTLNVFYDQTIPVEILCTFFSHLNTQELGRAEQVCKYWKHCIDTDCINNDSLWKNLFLRTFFRTVPKNTPGKLAMYIAKGRNL